MKNLRNYPLQKFLIPKHLAFFIVAFFCLLFGSLAASSQTTSAQVNCGGTTGLGGPRMPDLNSDGCVNDADLSILLSCWGFTFSNAPTSCKGALAPPPPAPSPPPAPIPAPLPTPPPPAPMPVPTPPPPASQGKVYYVANSGSDANDGLTALTPWRTQSRASGQELEPGDTIRFKRGDIWREGSFMISNSGSPGQPITITNWGDSQDVLPIFAGSWDYGSSTSLWAHAGGNIWKTARGSIPREPGQLWRDGHKTAKALKRETAESQLDIQWDYWYDRTNNLLAIFSVANPATAAVNIEVPIHANGSLAERSSGSGINYIVWDGLALLYGRDVNWVTSGQPHEPATGWEIRNSQVAYCGGQTLQRGNCIDMHGSSQGIVVDNNEVWEPFDSCISPQNWNSNDSINNIRITNNYLHDCSSGVEVQTYTIEGASFDVVEIRDVLIAGNMIDCHGGSFAVGFNQVGDNGIHFVNHSRGTTKRVTISDNVIKGCASPGSSDGNGIRFVTVGSAQFSSDNSGHIIERNRIFNNQNAGLWFECSNCSSHTNITGVEIRNNFIFNNGNEEVFLWFDWDETRLINNTIVDLTTDTDALVKGEYNNDFVMHNNILAASNKKFVDFNRIKTANYNLYWGQDLPSSQFTWGSVSYAGFAGFQNVAESNGQNTDPLFVDEAGAVFDITVGSPAKDAGLDREHNFATDFYGQPKQGAAWDMGAHEL